jgi:MmgE/PrpD N-terminal domain
VAGSSFHNARFDRKGKRHAIGAAAHAIEMDDTHNAGSIHLGVVMFCAALALAEYLPDVSVVAVLYRAAGIDQFTEENVLSKSVRRIMGRVWRQ